MPRIIISEPGKTPQPYRLKTDRESTTIGRGEDNDIILKTGSASGYHCSMKRVDGGFILEDQNSTNGIKVDDLRYEIIDLKDGATVLIGDDIELSFVLSEEEIEILAEEDFKPQQKAMFPKAKDSAKKKPSSKPKEIELDDEEDDDEYEEVVVRRKKTKKKEAVDLDDDEDFLAPVKPKKKRDSALKKNQEDEDDDDDFLEVAKPRAKKEESDFAAPVSAPAPPAPAKSGGGFFSTILFVILAILCLLGGMAIRHYQDHGKFLFTQELMK